VYRLIKDDIVDGNDLVQVGLRGTYADLDTLQWMREQGIRYHTMAEVESRGWESVLSRVVDEVRAGPDRLYISFDVSVLDPGEGSAQGRAAPGGLLVREVTPLIRRLCAEKQIAGFEVMDLAPVLDLSYVSAMNANYVMNACLAGMAMRKQDMDPEYVSPIALDHGQD
jgi:agmatinase